MVAQRQTGSGGVTPRTLHRRKMRIGIIIGLMIMVAPVGAGRADAVEIVVPDARVSSARSRLTVVGRSVQDHVTVEINGNTAATVPVIDGWFHAPVYLPYGLNEIRVHEAPAVADSAGGPAAASEPASDVVEVLCGPRIPRNYEKIFVSHAFHGNSHDMACLECHAQPAAALDDDATWCFTCHGRVREKFRSHVPGDTRSCTNCHRMSQNLSQVSTGVFTDMNPCFMCHKDKIGEFAQDYIHGPVAGGTCTVCHDPHGSKFAKTLRSPVPVLCLFCHTSVTDEYAPVQHGPFVNGRCTACHDPHATANKWVLVKSSRSICLGCHGEDGRLTSHDHPYDVKPKGRIERSLVLSNDGELECLTCHRAHGSSARALLRSESENVCLGCHPEHG